jgi:hypothetical protein
LKNKAVLVGVLLATLSLPTLTVADPGGTKSLKSQLDLLAKPSVNGTILSTADYNPQINCGPCPAYDVYVSYANYGNRTAYFTNMTVTIGILSGTQIVVIHVGNVPGRTIHSLGVATLPTRPDSVNVTFQFKDLG